jgi:hypothetical protein
MKVVDRGNIFDKANDRDYRNANPNDLTIISDEVYSHYIRYSQCEYCPVNSGLGNVLCKDPKFCNLKNHDCSDKKSKSDKKKPVIETKSSGSNLDIFLSRSTLVFLHHNKIPFIFRTGRHNGIIQHHKDGNPLNDRPENICMLFIPTHMKHHGTDKKLSKIIDNFRSLVNENPLNKEYAFCLKNAINLREILINTVETEDGVWETIGDECKLLGVDFKRPT